MQRCTFHCQSDHTASNVGVKVELATLVWKVASPSKLFLQPHRLRIKLLDTKRPHNYIDNVIADFGTHTKSVRHGLRIYLAHFEIQRLAPRSRQSDYRLHDMFARTRRRHAAALRMRYAATVEHVHLSVRRHVYGENTAIGGNT